MRHSGTVSQTSLPEWQTTGVTDDLDEALTSVGPRLRELRQRGGLTLTELSAATRHLDEHAEPPRVRRPASHPGAAAAARAGARRPARRPGRRAADRRPPGAPATRDAERHDAGAAVAARGRHPGVQDGHPAAPQQPGA